MYFCISTFSSTLIYLCRTSCIIFLFFSLLRDVTPIPALKVGQAPVVINRDLINTAINLMKSGWVFVPLCCDKRPCTLNCKYCQNVLALPLKKN